jgi:hypothetical protein
VLLGGWADGGLVCDFVSFYRSSLWCCTFGCVDVVYLFIASVVFINLVFAAVLTTLSHYIVISIVQSKCQLILL